MIEQQDKWQAAAEGVIGVGSMRLLGDMDFLITNADKTKIFKADSLLYLGELYRDVDGFFYYAPPDNGGVFSAHFMRQIADKLDEMNKEWQEQITRDLSPNDEVSHERRM